MVEGGEIDSVNYVVASVGVEAGEEALSHETVPPEHIIAEAAAEVGAEGSEGELAVEPEGSVADLGIIVVSILVADTENLSRAVGLVVIYIILDLSRSGVVVAVGKVIDIDIVITAKEVCNYLVILGTVDFGIKTSCQDCPFRSSPFEVRGKIEVLLIDMALFLDIFGAVSALAAISHLVCHIDIVETVPVDMDNIRIG